MIAALCFGLGGVFITASTPTQQYALVIGNNTPLVTSKSENLPELRYADDDAAAMTEFLETAGADVTLLSVLDQETQRRFPGLAAQASPPTMAKLTQAVDRIRDKIKNSQNHGERTVVWLFFSGHGQLSPEGAPALALLDAGLTQPVLYQLLARLPADVVHLLVDACHAEAVVHVRGVPERTHAVATQATDVEAFANKRSLARFPNVGAVVATAADQPAHEWNVYENGIFTHQLLSALRGAADVNNDGRIEYSELHAFLAAANREISDSRAKLAVVLKAPPVDQRTALVDVHELHSVGWAIAAGETLDRFWIEDERGVRLVDINREAGAPTTLALPAETTLFLRTAEAEASFALKPGQALSLDQLALHSTTIAARGAIASALERGLFASAYGPIYYRGFVDSSHELAVNFTTVHRTAMLDPSAPARRAAIGFWLSAGAAAAASATFFALMAKDANTYNSTPSAAAATSAGQRYDTDRIVGLATGGAALCALFAGLAVFPWEMPIAPSVGTAHGQTTVGIVGRY